MPDVGGRRGRWGWGASAWMARLLLAAAALSALPATGQGQVGAIRRAREAIRDRLPSLASLFGDTPALTTSIEDGKDGVALLDSFNPGSYAPMLEMPRGPEGSVLLSPGVFVMMVESFCLQPGTFGPHLGEGYLHTEWKGPKAEVIRNILKRYPDHPEVPQQDAQKLLWAILARSRFETLRTEVKLAAGRLLTPSELSNLAGFGLDAVENGLRDRVLASLPTAVRRAYEAENDLRRMLASAEAEYAQMEQTAVRDGAIPLEESIFTLPDTRWSYHPNGYFIRYQPRSYKVMRVDVYMPDRIQIERDASGRIISIRGPDGRQLDTEYSAGHVVEGLFRIAEDPLNGWHPQPTDWRPERLRLVSDGPPGPVSWIPAVRDDHSAGRRRAILADAERGDTPDARAELLALAWMDIADLAAIRASMTRKPARATAKSLAFMNEALHSAVARYVGLAGLEQLPAASPMAASLRPVRTFGGFSYLVAPVPTSATGLAQRAGSMRPFPPGGGGASGAGSRQRLAPTLRQFNGRSNAPGASPPNATSGPPGEPDALDKAQDVVRWFSAAMDAFGAVTDPAGFIGGQPQGQMLGAGLDAAFSNARQISNSLGGSDDDHHDAGERARGEWRPGPGGPVELTPASLGGGSPARGRRPPRGQGGVADYRIVAAARTIQFEPLAAGAIPGEHATAVNATIGSAFRMAMALEAVVHTQPRLRAAVAAQDAEWVETQARALVRLKRQAGIEMVQFSRDLDALMIAAGPARTLGEPEARTAQQRLSADGWTPAALSVYRQLGRSEGDIEAARQRVISTDARATAESFLDTVRHLRDAVYAYGGYLALLPVVSEAR